MKDISQLQTKLCLLPYIYIYIYTHTHTHTYICVYIYIYTHTHTHTHIYICMYICIYESHSYIVSSSLWPTDCRLPGSSVHQILQARILECWSGCLSLLQGNIPNPGIALRSPILQVDSLNTFWLTRFHQLFLLRKAHVWEYLLVVLHLVYYLAVFNFLLELYRLSFIVLWH